MATLARRAVLAGWDRDALLRGVGVVAVAGGLAGILVGGIGSRVAMRISGAMSDPALVGIARTNNGNVLGDVTFGGTLALIVFGGILPGILGGLVYLTARPWLVPLGRWSGVAYGLALLCATGPLILEPFNIDFRKFGSPQVNVALFALLFPLFGVALVGVTDVVRRRIEGAGRGSAWEALPVLGLVATAFVLVFVGVAVVGTVGSMIAGTFSVGAPPDPRPFALFYFAGVALVLRVLLGRDRPLTDARELGSRDRALSYGALLVPAVLGLPSTIEAISFLTRP